MLYSIQALKISLFCLRKYETFSEISQVKDSEKKLSIL